MDILSIILIFAVSSVSANQEGCLVPYPNNLPHKKGCQTCKPFYRPMIIQGVQKCERCSDLNCKSCSNSARWCQICKNGYYKDKEELAKCLKIPTENCLSAQESTGKCYSCQDDYFLVTKDSKNICIAKSEFPNCQKVSTEGKCVFCKIGYRLKQDKTCEQCGIENCAACPQSSSKCSACFPRFYPESSSDITSCLRCQDENCTSCSYAGNCLQCQEGFWPKEEPNCVGCPDSNCLVCDQSIGKCHACKTGYFLDLQRNCVKCSDNCVACYGLGKCFACKKGYYMNYDDGKLICLPCKAGCSFCPNDQECWDSGEERLGSFKMLEKSVF